MARIAFITLPDPGHAHPLAALARALQRRGHEAVFVTIADRASAVEGLGFAVAVIGSATMPPGWLAARNAERAALGGWALTRWTLTRFMPPLVDAVMDEGPATLAAHGIDAVVADQDLLGGATIARAAGLPSITVSCSLLDASSPTCPPVTLPLARQRAPGHWCTRIAAMADGVRRYCLARPLIARVDAMRARHGLRPLRQPADEFSPRLHLAPQPPEFEPLAATRPPSHRFAGPWIDLAARPPCRFPWSRLDGRPLIYATLGTLLGGRPERFHAIATACADLPVQLVIAQGNRDAAHLPGLPGDPLVVRFAPQIELLQRATLMVTHAGLNGVLEALSMGVPLVAMPIGYDQPGVAARVVRAGCGIALESDATPGALRRAIGTVLDDDRFRAAARSMAAAMVRSGGVERAAALAEEALLAGEQVAGTGGYPPGPRHGATAMR